MRKSTKCLLSLIASGLTVAPIVAQTTAPSATPVPASRPAIDSKAMQAYQKDIQNNVARADAVLQHPADWHNPDHRKEISDKIESDLKAIVTRTDEMIRNNHTPEAQMVGISQFYVWVEVFGSDGLKKQLEDMTPRTGLPDAWYKTAQAGAAFYLANGDVVGQSKALDRLEALLTADPNTKVSLGLTLFEIYLSKPSKKISDRLENFYTNALKYGGITIVKKREATKNAKMDLVGKPMVLEGRLKDGSHFSTADLKGKVILIDFWATWCGPCKAELPRVKREYAELHDKGLEVIGVSFDEAEAPLTKFLSANPEMPWPQFYDPAHPMWQNEFGRKYGIQGIPEMFLIDKNGVCRSITAREDFEKQIAQLLAEKVSP